MTGTAITRELEKRHGLRELAAVSPKKSYEEIGQHYQVSKGILRVLKEAKELDKDSPLLRLDDEVDSILAPLQNRAWQKMCDKEIKACYEEALGQEEGERDYLQLYGYLRQTEAIVLSYKRQLLIAVKDAARESTTIWEYEEALRRNGYYIRAVRTKDGGKKYVYGIPKKEGIPAKSYYFNENQLDKRLSHLSTNMCYEMHGEPHSCDKSKEQKIIVRYIHRHVTRALYTAYGMGMLEGILSKKGIGVECAKNAGGVYGISFRSSYGSTKAHTIKGSKILLGWQKICWLLERNRKRVEEKHGEFKRQGLAIVPKSKQVLPRLVLYALRSLASSQEVQAAAGEQDKAQNEKLDIQRIQAEEKTETETKQRAHEEEQGHGYGVSM